MQKNVIKQICIWSFWPTFEFLSYEFWQMVKIKIKTTKLSNMMTNTFLCENPD